MNLPVTLRDSSQSRGDFGKVRMRESREVVVCPHKIREYFLLQTVVRESSLSLFDTGSPKGQLGIEVDLVFGVVMLMTRGSQLVVVLALSLGLKQSLVVVNVVLIQYRVGSVRRDEAIMSEIKGLPRCAIYGCNKTPLSPKQEKLLGQGLFYFNPRHSEVLVCWLHIQYSLPIVPQVHEQGRQLRGWESDTWQGNHVEMIVLGDEVKIQW